jgi:hypothetical protein
VSLSPPGLVALVIDVVLLALAGYYGWRQVQVLRDLRRRDDLSVEDRRYMHRQARRRLVQCGLMVVFAGLLAGSFFVFGLEERASQLGNQVAEEPGQRPSFDPEQKRFVYTYTIYWIVALLVLMVLVWLAAVDLFAIRRFGMRHHRQIQEDRRAMIANEVARLRGQRNGHT